MPDLVTDVLPDHLDDAPADVTAPSTGLLRFARMTGSSIAGRDAAPWVTDFLNAAYYRRPVGERDVDDVRLAQCVLTTYWYAKPGRRRLGLLDLQHFHRCFAHARLTTEGSVRGTLTRAELTAGAGDLIGRWFEAAYADDDRRGWGIAFETPQDRDDYDHAPRMALARLGELTPEHAPAAEQVWHTYPPVVMPSAEGVIAALTAPETWPDFASDIGRFTPLRPGGLAGQTFEIDVAAGTDAGRPMFTRGYVTITDLVTPADPEALAAWFAAVEAGLDRFGDDEPRAVPEGGTPVVGFDLTTHQGHFMGPGHNRLLLYTHEGQAWVRAAGTWDPMSWAVGAGYRRAREAAQAAFWGEGDVVPSSLLHELALHVAARA